MKGCSMERKSIGCDIRSLPGCARTRILEAWSRSKPASLEYLPASPNPSGTLSVLARAVSGPFCDRSVRRSEEHTSELQSRRDLVCRLLLEKKKKKTHNLIITSLLSR